eukprot:scaffold252395_cov15-Tisochrysis_lutea.AAC.1
MDMPLRDLGMERPFHFPYLKELHVGAAACAAHDAGYRNLNLPEPAIVITTTANGSPHNT